MGFRSTLISEDWPILWPDWFVQKYDGLLWFHESKRGALASRVEAKTYSVWATLPEDIQRAIDWEGTTLRRFVFVYLHECGGITRCQVEPGAIKWTEPDEWRATNGVEHSYCTGCSDA